MVYFFIIILSLILNWGVQLSYYSYRIRKNPQAFRGQKTLLQYYTGYIGDGIIVPLINILIYYIIVKIGYNLTVKDLVWFYAGGLILDIAAHYIQGHFSMTNWSMPQPFRWNGAGYWHMISFPIQMAYLLLFGKVLVTYWTGIWSLMSTRVSVLSIVAFMVLFVVLYCIDNNWISLKNFKRIKFKL